MQREEAVKMMETQPATPEPQIQGMKPTEPAPPTPARRAYDWAVDKLSRKPEPAQKTTAPIESAPAALGELVQQARDIQTTMLSDIQAGMNMIEQFKMTLFGYMAFMERREAERLFESLRPEQTKSRRLRHVCPAVVRTVSIFLKQDQPTPDSAHLKPGVASSRYSASPRRLPTHH